MSIVADALVLCSISLWPKTTITDFPPCLIPTTTALNTLKSVLKKKKKLRQALPNSLIYYGPFSRVVWSKEHKVPIDLRGFLVKSCCPPELKFSPIVQSSKNLCAREAIFTMYLLYEIDYFDDNQHRQEGKNGKIIFNILGSSTELTTMAKYIIGEISSFIIKLKNVKKKCF